MSGPTSVEQLVNQAFDRIGYPEYIGNIYEGTKQSRIALNVYAETRDKLLRNGDWGFSERTVALTLLKQAPPAYIPPMAWSTAYPPLPWMFEYAYPTDCLKVRAVKPVTMFVPNFDPQPHVFDTPNDYSLTPPAKVIVCNVPDAVMIYTGQVTDPGTWEPDFVETVIAALARLLGPSLTNMDVAKMEASDEASAKAKAEQEQG